MLYSCTILKNLDLSSFHTEKFTLFSAFFVYINSNLIKLLVIFEKNNQSSNIINNNVFFFPPIGCISNNFLTKSIWTII